MIIPGNTSQPDITGKYKCYVVENINSNLGGESEYVDTSFYDTVIVSLSNKTRVTIKNVKIFYTGFCKDTMDIEATIDDHNYFKSNDSIFNGSFKNDSISFGSSWTFYQQSNGHPSGCHEYFDWEGKKIK